MNKQQITSKYLGIPYKNKGRDLKGLDCYGLVIMIYRDLGFELLDYWQYAQDWYKSKKDLINENYKLQWEKVEFPEIYDIVVMKLKSSIPNHCAVYLGNYKVIHVYENSDVHIDDLTLPQWKSKIYGCFRFKNKL